MKAKSYRCSVIASRFQTLEKIIRPRGIGWPRVSVARSALYTSNKMSSKRRTRNPCCYCLSGYDMWLLRSQSQSFL